MPSNTISFEIEFNDFLRLSNTTCRLWCSSKWQNYTICKSIQEQSTYAQPAILSTLNEPPNLLKLLKFRWCHFLNPAFQNLSYITCNALGLYNCAQLHESLHLSMYQTASLSGTIIQLRPINHPVCWKSWTGRKWPDWPFICLSPHWLKLEA